MKNEYEYTPDDIVSPSLAMAFNPAYYESEYKSGLIEAVPNKKHKRSGSTRYFLIET